MVQDCPPFRLVPQLFVCEKGPVVVIPLMVSVVAPAFVSVTGCGLPSQTQPITLQVKNSWVGASSTTVPVPFCGNARDRVIISARDKLAGLATGAGVTWSGRTGAPITGSTRP